MPSTPERTAEDTARTIPQLIVDAAKSYGGHAFVVENEVTISFAALAVHAKSIAASLIGRGIQKGDRVAVWAPNIHEWVLAALGSQCAGAILVTLNTRYKGSEAAYILRKSQAKILFCIGDFLGVDYPGMLEGEHLPDLQELVVFRCGETPHTSWNAFLETGNQVPGNHVTERMAEVLEDDISDILFTSGTTGNPKGVMTSHGQNLRAFSSFGSIVGFGSNDRYLVINPFFHSYGYKAGILACLLKGTTLYPHAVFNVADILQRIASERITVLPGPPTIFQSILADPELSRYDISSLRFATTGAAVIPVEMIERMYSTLGFERVVTAYGLTECCGLATICRAGDSPETVAYTSGRAIPGVEVRCVDMENRRVAPGEAGEIVIRGFNVMKGYFDASEATDEAIDSDGWLHTGDIGILDREGNLRITDRLKDMFISGGFNCYPAEIEKIIAGHPDIAMNAIIGIPDDRLGEVAMAFVVRRPAASLDAEHFIAWCRKKMANYKVPRKVEFVDQLPLNAAGKVVKPTLRARARPGCPDIPRGESA